MPELVCVRTEDCLIPWSLSYACPGIVRARFHPGGVLEGEQMDGHVCLFCCLRVRIHVYLFADVGMRVARRRGVEEDESSRHVEADGSG